jgi:hypothetical protein
MAGKQFAGALAAAALLAAAAGCGSASTKPHPLFARTPFPQGTPVTAISMPALGLAALEPTGWTAPAEERYPPSAAHPGYQIYETIQAPGAGTLCVFVGSPAPRRLRGSYGAHLRKELSKGSRIMFTRRIAMENGTAILVQTQRHGKDGERTLYAGFVNADVEVLAQCAAQTPAEQTRQDRISFEPMISSLRLGAPRRHALSSG